MTVRAVVYARHSTEAQAGSVTQQLDAARAYAAAHGYDVAATFQDEAKSGKSAAGRDGLAAFLAFVARRPRAAEVVLLWDASRLSRDQDDAAIMRAQLRKAGYRVEYVGDTSINVGGKEQRIVEALADYRADAFRADLARNVKRGMLAALEQGGAWGRPPKGYDVADGKLVANDDLPRVIEAYRLRAAGHSYREIHNATRLFNSKHGYSWLLSNPFYAGVVRFDGRDYPAGVPAAIGPELWAAVCAVNARRIHPRRASSSYMLSGLAYCATCGRLMNGHGSKEHVDGTYYRYYHCRKFADKKLNCKPVRAAELEARVVKEVSEYFTPTRFRKVYAEWRRLRLAEIAAGRAGGDRARQDLARLDAQITRLTAAIEAGGKLAGLLAQLQKRETERAELAAKLAQPAPKPPPVLDIAPFCEKIRAALQAGDDHARRLAVRAVVDRVTVAGPGAVSVTMITPERLLGL